MPLDPKQQPPYYTPGTTETIQNKYTRLNAQFNEVLTSGTTETTMYEYNLPPNTLPTNGDGIHLLFCSQNTAGNGDSHLHRIYINNVVQFGVENLVSPNDTVIDLTLIRISTTQLKLLMQAYGSTATAGGKPTVNIQTVNSLDFTAIIPIKITADCAGAGVVQTYFQTIDKIII